MLRFAGDFGIGSGGAFGGRRAVLTGFRRTFAAFQITGHAVFGISPAVGSLRAVSAVGDALVFGRADFALFGIAAQPAGQPMVSYGRALVSAVVGAGVFGSVVIAGAGVSTGQTRSVAAVVAVFF